MANEEKKSIEQKILPWRFWFSVILTAFLVVTFGWYLPMRFQYYGMHMMHMHPNIAYEAEDRNSPGPDVRMNYTITNGEADLSFHVIEKSNGAPVPASALQMEHTKLMHVVGVRDDLNEFFHIHPFPGLPASSTPELGATYGENTDGVFGVRHIFTKPGRYKMWVEVTKGNVTYIVGQRPLMVGGIREGEASSTAMATPAFLDTARIGNDTIVFTHDPVIVKNREARLAFTIRDQSGKAIPLEPYLGADMHLNIIKSDWSAVIHTHPSTMNMMMLNMPDIPSLVSIAHAHDATMMSGQSSGQADQSGIPFRVTLPTAGVYKAFAQFRPAGSALPPDQPIVAAFWFEVKESGPASLPPASAPPKAALVLISLAGMLFLGWGVKKFLDVTSKTPHL